MTAHSKTETLHTRAQQLGDNLPPLLLAAEKVASIVSQGIHGRRQVGKGETFWEFRRYKFGDPAQRIDWRQSAKSDRVYIKETEWEAAQSIWLWRDTSNSMTFSSKQGQPDKLARATLLELALAALLMRGGENVALSGEHTGKPKLTLLEMAETLSQDITTSEAAFVDVDIPRNARVVMFSDFLETESDRNTRETSLKRLAGQGVGGVIVHIYDPVEQSLPYKGRVNFEGLEGEPDMMIERVEHVSNAYQQVWQDHVNQLKEFAANLGWSFISHNTNEPPYSALTQIYAKLSGGK